MLSLSILLRLQAALQGVGPALRGLLRPKMLRFRFSGIPQKHRLGLACVLCLPWSEQLRHLTNALSLGAGRLIPSAVPASVSVCASQVHLVSVLGSWTLAATLLVDVDHPESHGSIWLEAGSLFAIW